MSPGDITRHIFDGDLNRKYISRGMSPEYLPLLAADHFSRLLKRSLKELVMLPRIYFRHQHLYILANHLVFSGIPEHFEHAHVALCDLPELLLVIVPVDKHAR